jgi:hypothetical protein
MGVSGKLSDCNQGTPDTWTCKSTMTPKKDTELSPYPFEILGTDYDRWAVMYNCLAPMGDMMSMDHIWIYSRTQSLSEIEMQEIRSIIRAQLPGYNLTALQMYSTVQDDRCVYENDKFSNE